MADGTHRLPGSGIGANTSYIRTACLPAERRCAVRSRSWCKTKWVFPPTCLITAAVVPAAMLAIGY